MRSIDAAENFNRVPVSTCLFPLSSSNRINHSRNLDTILNTYCTKIPVIGTDKAAGRRKRTSLPGKFIEKIVIPVIMGGYSSDGSSSFFTLKKPDDHSWGEADHQWMELVGFVEDHKTEVSAINGLHESITDQDQLNQVEISEGSCHTKSKGGRPKFTLAQKRENKRLSDYRYRQKRKITADELNAENKHLKVENERLIAENTLLKSLIDSLLCNGRHENNVSKAEAEPSSSSGQPPAQDSVHLRARRAQATDHHKAMRAQISESTKSLKDLIPGCNKVYQ
ncbi:uncharacterized protein LOC120155416 [Hibiscus syriacus]|uniref:uncharacterized protein LOC120155416 n=1 Tax=Hibiscus syriacus TaxID=106335 RepID=UPI001922534C|nr:uncharacterized protein LOC120155416 [Hibiscus syriacus]